MGRWHSDWIIETPFGAFRLVRQGRLRLAQGRRDGGEVLDAEMERGIVFFACCDIESGDPEVLTAASELCDDEFTRYHSMPSFGTAVGSRVDHLVKKLSSAVESRRIVIERIPLIRVRPHAPQEDVASPAPLFNPLEEVALVESELDALDQAVQAAALRAAAALAAPFCEECEKAKQQGSMQA
jgi:hypothetical protein